MRSRKLPESRKESCSSNRLEPKATHDRTPQNLPFLQAFSMEIMIRSRKAVGFIGFESV